MSFQFICPHCHKKTLVDESYVGQQGACAGCGKNVTITEQPKKLHAANLRKTHPPSPAPTQSSVTNSPSFLKHPIVRKLIAALLGVVALVVFGFVAWKLASAFSGLALIQKIQERSERAQCMNNLSKIARALNQYAASHGTYPPPIVYAEDGKPMHSWRVLILQELGEYHLYNQYKFDEPWDSESNSALIGSLCPRVFISPGRSDHRYAAESSYFLVVGDGTLFPSSEAPLSPDKISDGQENCLLVVEAQNTAHEWTKPIDIDFRNTRGTATTVGIGGTHDGGFTAAFADGVAAWIPSDTPQEQVRAMITPQGGESVDRTPYLK